MGAIMSTLFKGEGQVILWIFGLAFACWAFGTLASALGKGQYVNLINLAGLLIGLGLVLTRFNAVMMMLATFLGI